MPSLPGTALLVIDAQESFRVRAEDWARTANTDALPRISSLVTHAREKGDLVVWVTHADPGSAGPFDPDSGHVRIFSELDPREDEPAITKTSINAFTTTNLQQQLLQRGIGHVVICGIRTEQCCETTARVASDLGFTVDFVTDATTTSGIPAQGTLSAVSGEEIMRRTESILSARGFARILTTAQRLTA